MCHLALGPTAVVLALHWPLPADSGGAGLGPGGQLHMPVQGLQGWCLGVWLPGDFLEEDARKRPTPTPMGAGSCRDGARQPVPHVPHATPWPVMAVPLRPTCLRAPGERSAWAPETGSRLLGSGQLPCGLPRETPADRTLDVVTTVVGSDVLVCAVCPVWWAGTLSCGLCGRQCCMWLKLAHPSGGTSLGTAPG